MCQTQITYTKTKIHSLSSYSLSISNLILKKIANPH